MNTKVNTPSRWPSVEEDKVNKDIDRFVDSAFPASNPKNKVSAFGLTTKTPAPRKNRDKLTVKLK